MVLDQASAGQKTEGSFRNFKRRLKIKLAEARKSNKPLYTMSSNSIFDQHVNPNCTLALLMETENLAFILNPIICYVCCGDEAQYLYCELPSRQDFKSKGSNMDCDVLKQQVKSLLSSGTVNITELHLSRGRGGILVFSLEVLDALFAHMSQGTKIMLKEFQDFRRVLGGVKELTGLELGAFPIAAEELAGLRAENAMYREQIATTAKQLAKAGERSAVLKEQLKELRQRLLRSTNKVVQKTRSLKACREKSRQEMLITLPDGTKAKTVLVENKAYDPRAERSEAEKRKHGRSICFSWAILYVKGNKEPRPGKDKNGNAIGGVRFTFEARMIEYMHTSILGLCAFRRSAWLRESYLDAKVVQMRIVPMDRNRRFSVRGTPEMRLLNPPSRKVVLYKIIPTFQLMFFYYAFKLLNDPSTLSIGACADGTHVRGFGVFGAVFSVYQWHKGEEDPLGNVLFVYTCRRFHGPLVRTVNKFVKTMRDAHGNRFPPEAGLCFAKILWASNVATLFLSRPDMFALVFDGASENTGEGGKSARASLCNPNSIWDLTVNKLTAWIHLQEQAEKAGLRDTVHGFFEIPADFPWPKAEQDLGAPLETSGPVLRDMEVVNAMDNYPRNPKFGWLRTDRWNEILDSSYESSEPVPAACPVVLRKYRHIVRQYWVLWSSAASDISKRFVSKRRWLREEEPGIKGSWQQFKHRYHVLWGTEVEKMRQPLRSEEEKVLFLRSCETKIQEILKPLFSKEEREHNAARPRKHLFWHRKELLRRMQDMRVFAAKRHRMETVGKLLKNLIWFLKRRRGRLVSMHINPAMFFPCLCLPDGRSLPVVGHCGCHRVNLLTDLFVFCMNADILHQAVSFTKFLRCDYHWPQIKAAINHLLKRLKDGEARIEFYQKILDLIDAAKLILRCRFDEDKGAEMPVVAALTRWGTTLKALSNLFRKHPIYACALIPNFAHGPEHILVKACVDILSEQGFNSEDYAELKLEKCAERIFNFLTRTRDILQMAIGHVLHVCVMQILLAAVSSNHECGAPLSRGMESVVRAILLMFRRDFFVRVFPWGGWGKSWNRRAAIGCRTHGAEFDSAPSIRLLNPLCEEKVKARLRVFACEFPNMESLVDEASRAVSEYVETAKMLARREGQILPEDSKEIWKRCFPDQADDNSYVARMSQAQWLFAQVSEDVVLAIIKLMLRELYHMFGFIANAGKTTKSKDKYTFAKSDSTTYQCEVLIPGLFSHPNAVVALVQGRDMIATYKEKGVNREEFLKRMPKPVAGVLSEEGIQQIMQFLGIDEDADSAFLKYIVEHPSSDKAENARFYRGCHLPDPSRNHHVATPDGKVDLVAYRRLPKAISCFEKLSRHSAEASNTQTTSKPIEGGFSILTANARVRGAAEMPLMSGIMQMDNYNKSGINIRDVEEKIHWKGDAAVGKAGWKDWFYARDDKKGYEMRMVAMHNDLPKKAKNGGVYKYKNTYHGGQARTNKWRRLNPDSNTPEGRRFKRRIEAVRERSMRGNGFQFQGAEGQGGDSQDQVGAKGKDGAAGKEAAPAAKVGAKRKDGAAGKEAAPAAKKRRVNDAAKKRVMERLDSARRGKAVQARPAGDEAMTNPPAREKAAGDTAGPARSSKKIRPSLSADPDYSVGEGESVPTGLEQARRSERNRPIVDYSADAMDIDPAADEEPPPQAGHAGGSAEASAAGNNAPVVCAVGVGARVEIYWEGGWGWSPGTVTAISTGRTQHPTNRDQYAAAGYAIVQYDAEGSRPCVHNLDRVKHFDTLGQKEFAWRELPDSGSAGIGEGGTSAAGERPALPSRSAGSQPGGADCAQASADRANGDQGGKPSKRAGDVDSSSSEESDESDESDGSDGSDEALNPRPSRSAGKKSKATEMTPVAVTCAVEVGKRVEVRWKDGQGGWCSCVVLKVSTGRTQNPRCKNEYVAKGHAICEYSRGWKCHHNLDREHHVSLFGDREWAWREPEVSVTKLDARAGARAGAKVAAKPASRSNNDGEKAPLCGSKGGSSDKGCLSEARAAGGAVGPEASSGSKAAASFTSDAAQLEAGSAVSSSSTSATEPVPSPWSLTFCEKYYFPQTRIRRSNVTFDQGTYEVTRKSVAGAQQPNTIKFSVVAGSGRMFYIAHSPETGPIIVSVQNVSPPSEGDWSETLKCCRVYTSRAAMTRSRSPNDMLGDKGGVAASGRSSLHVQACRDEKSGTQTYHVGDTQYRMDVRHVVGVLRWAPVVYRPDDADSLPDFPEGYWSGCPKEADLIYVGHNFSQVI